ncbi:GNAT family N-acetyltransferase [Halobacillus sp. Nhm2S1]|uniref:GNAT family N-acetyltransferase n=1 Tax=Halobacillus sp. Nhm2S1 TaxID=2866716 RepID=UPI001C7369E5|nr:GNAT family N-acetyltransferase [Halobacillus sp. Nhm2S1]MBX0357026.1 GNAT family N-acetyltransferase [Halobacillus sp. Nhm2S1]
MEVLQLKVYDMDLHMLDTFHRYQKTDRVWVDDSGGIVEESDSFEEDWTLENKQEIIHHFRFVSMNGGAVVAVMKEQQVQGFAVIEPTFFGGKSRYRELSYIHVTRDLRGQGIGKRLFQKAGTVAKALGAEKLYIGAHPSVETQRFYQKMGCVPAQEIHPTIYAREPRDIQLEKRL